QAQDARPGRAWPDQEADLETVGKAGRLRHGHVRLRRRVHRVRRAGQGPSVTTGFLRAQARILANRHQRSTRFGREPAAVHDRDDLTGLSRLLTLGRGNAPWQTLVVEGRPPGP